MGVKILGRDQVSSIPGVANDDIESVEIGADGDELDATVFLGTALTQVETQVGLVDIPVVCNCTHHTATVGDQGTFEVGKVDDTSLESELVVIDIEKTVTPKGREGYKISYALTPLPPP
jgi:hypothetical protein